MSISGRPTAKSTAILLACRTTYQDSVSILYKGTVVEVSVRSDCFDKSFPRFQVSLGAIDDCSILTRLRHIELEISYDANNVQGLQRLTARILKLAAVFKEMKKLKTIDLIFFDQGTSSRDSMSDRRIMNTESMLDAATQLPCKKMTGVSRNMAAKRSMSEVKWTTLRSQIGQDVDVEWEEERFREISFDYWEHAFRSKN